MIKHSFALVFLSILCGITSAQTEIANANFEDWSNEVYWEDPVPFTTANLQAFLSGNSGNAIKTTESHGGLYACRLETANNDLGSFPGALFIGTPSLDLIEGGLPFEGSPDSIKFFAQYHIAEGDSAVMYCILQGGGLPVALGFQSITGESTDWVEYTAPMDFLFAISPDLLSLIFSSSDFTNPNAESWITVDDIQFVYNGLDADPFPGGDFEEWIEVGSEEPDDWNTSNPFTEPIGQSVQKSPDAYNGLYSVRIETLPTPFEEGDNIGFLINGFLGEDVINGGLTLSGNEIPTSFSGYYKYNPIEETDSAGVLFLLRKYNDLTTEFDTLIEGELNLPAAANFTFFEIELPIVILNEWVSEGTFPDLLTIGFSSSKLDDENYDAPEGSVLWVDALNVDYYLGVGELDSKNSIVAYPNPASEAIQLSGIDLHLIRSMKVINAMGACVRNMTQIKWGEMHTGLTLDIASLPNGNYTILLETEAELITKKISVIH